MHFTDRDMDLLELSAYGNVRRGPDSGGCRIQWTFFSILIYYVIDFYSSWQDLGASFVYRQVKTAKKVMAFFIILSSSTTLNGFLLRSMIYEASGTRIATTLYYINVVRKYILIAMNLV